MLRQIKVTIANSKTTAVACKMVEITEQSYYRWRTEYGGLQVRQGSKWVLHHFPNSISRQPNSLGSTP